MGYGGLFLSTGIRQKNGEGTISNIYEGTFDGGGKIFTKMTRETGGSEEPKTSITKTKVQQSSRRFEVQHFEKKEEK